MSDRRKWKTVIAVFLVLSGITLLLFSGLRSDLSGERIYRVSGKETVIPDISLPNGKIRVNEADLAELKKLYGIGDALAQRIIEEREMNGDFRYPEDMTAVHGIGIKTVDGFREMINLQ